MFRLPNRSDCWIFNERFELLMKGFVQKFYKYVLCVKNERNPGTFNYSPGSGKAVIGLHPPPPREAGPLTHNIVLHNNLFYLQGNKIFRFWRCLFCGTVSHFGLPRFHYIYKNPSSFRPSTCSVSSLIAKLCRQQCLWLSVWL